MKLSEDIQILFLEPAVKAKMLNLCVANWKVFSSFIYWHLLNLLATKVKELKTTNNFC